MRSPAGRGRSRRRIHPTRALHFSVRAPPEFNATAAAWSAAIDGETSTFLSSIAEVNIARSFQNFAGRGARPPGASSGAAAAANVASASDVRVSFDANDGSHCVRQFLMFVHTSDVSPASACHRVDERARPRRSTALNSRRHRATHTARAATNRSAPAPAPTISDSAGASRSNPARINRGGIVAPCRNKAAHSTRPHDVAPTPEASAPSRINAGTDGGVDAAEGCPLL